MQRTNYLFLVLILLLFGCTPTPQPAPIETTSTKRSTAGLPPTWTPTAMVPPSQTPLRTPTQTFTPFPSVTPLPATLVKSPTSEIQTPIATATITPTRTLNCAVTALEEGVILQANPFFDPYGLLPTMIPDQPYEAVSSAPTYYELTLDNEPMGWVDYRLLALDIEGTCDGLSTDSRELTDFPDLCFFTPDNQEVTTYIDTALTEPYGTIAGETSYVLLLKLEEAYCTVVSHAGPSFCVAAQDIQLSGSCEKITRAGITTDEGWLWSLPDGESGKETVSFGSEMKIYFIEDPVDGPKPPSIDEPGNWYYVRIGHQNKGSYGWMWSSLFTFR